MKEQLKLYTNKAEKALSMYMKTEDNPQKSIYESMSYSLFAGGKRLRPVLMMAVCDMCGGNSDTVLPFAAAMEMIHTYSLIHDDLPAMDNDDLRRGMPTNHIKYGEATAILAGDALLNKAFETMSIYSELSAEKTLEIIKIISLSSGTEGMIGGQVVDIESENKKIDIDELKYIHTCKTGAIIRSAAVSGAVAANADKTQITAIDEFAKNLGIAFQICDDILDVTGDEKTLGKPIGSDEENCKTTYVTVYGLDGAKKLLDEYSQKAKDALAVFGDKNKFLIKLTDYLSGRNS